MTTGIKEINRREDLEDWYQIQNQIKDLKKTELVLRKKVFEKYFETPKEGVNTHDLKDGYKLKATYTYSRTISNSKLQDSLIGIRNLNIIPKELIEYKPVLVKSGYNKLSDEKRKCFDRFLTIKPKSPTLEIIARKKDTSK